MADTQNDRRYVGEPKIVLGLDVGTTQSAVSYVHLFPNAIPAVRIVNKWPGQEEVAGDSKIPSLVAYEGSRPIAYGAEALEYTNTEGYYVAKWFKLHLHPDSMKVVDEPPVYGSYSNTPPTFEIPPLPPSVSLKQIYAHLLGYLFDHAREFFKNNTVDGSRIWQQLGEKCVFVIATPNGWDTTQQAFLRSAAILGGLLPETFPEDRLRFVTEGEASVHYALEYSQSSTWLKKGVIFAVTDAGGSTVDSTLYECKETQPKMILEEVCASECVQAGSVFVDRGAAAMLDRKLEGSTFKDEAYLGDILEEFEKKTKRKFDGTQVNSIIKFGRDWDNDREHGIFKGRITLSKDEVQSTFNEVIPRIVNSCSNLLSGRKVEHLMLVGGFGESPYLRKQLKDTFGSKGVEVVTVDESTKKAAAEGAAIWHIKQLVVARAVRSTFGIIIWRPFDTKNLVHNTRRHKSYVDDDGVNKITGFFDTWIKKGSVIGDELSKVFNYQRIYKTLDNGLGSFSVDIYAWEGEGHTDWGRDESGNLLPNMRRVCTLKADLSGLARSLKVQKGPRGQDFWRVEHSVAVLFGGTQLRARLQWYEGDQLREGPVSVIPNSIF
ncbi:hypothetical protein M408DRAFT_331646 [Serendipita vermifera MAFF 305830]|uniref:Actin-like ATPase domain-containing protein n=1 Tax=Serendipita vermifera MAFF 305830 TaxID=933852 RepID=A0A0C2X5W4_SERVB|nr:hypothetical protein M408DRAFT_331646 [Serendipita vermifera MAFF 305830]